uniref:Uncharacterized protein n=1 Tax=Arundo donax TaxID=35708 RepID=A0A0A8YBB8_ARUDO
MSFLWVVMILSSALIGYAFLTPSFRISTSTPCPTECMAALLLGKVFLALGAGLCVRRQLCHA